MAEEVLTYKVEIDQADLAIQLADIKNQVDMAMGSLAFNQLNQGIINDPIVGTISRFSQFAGSSMQAVQKEVTEMQSLFMSGFESSRLGFRKFTHDLETAGLISGAGTPQLQSLYSASRSYAPSEIEESGFFGSLIGSEFGIGYDPNMAISRGEYMREMTTRFREQAPGKLWNVAAMGLSFVNLPLGLTMGAGKIITDAMDYENRAVETLGEFIEQSSFRNINQLSKTDSREAAKFIRNLSEDIDIRATVGDATDVENVVTTFAGAGGFLDTSNLEEYKRRAKEAVENFRLIQYTLNSTSEEALTVMGELLQTTGGNVEDIASLVQQASTIGTRSGFTTVEMLQLAGQAGEMVRGSGRDIQTAMTGAIQMQGVVREGALFTPELLQQFGGSQNLSLELLKSAYNYGTTPMGQVYAAARAGGQTEFLGVQETLQNALKTYGGFTPNEVLAAQIAQRTETKQISAQDLILQEATTIISEVAKANLDIKGPADYAQTLINLGKDPNIADALAAAVFANPAIKDEAYRAQAEDTAQALEDAEPTGLRKFFGGIGILGRNISKGFSEYMDTTRLDREDPIKDINLETLSEEDITFYRNKAKALQSKYVKKEDESYEDFIKRVNRSIKIQDRQEEYRFIDAEETISDEDFTFYRRKIEKMEDFKKEFGQKEDESDEDYSQRLIGSVNDKRLNKYIKGNLQVNRRQHALEALNIDRQFSEAEEEMAYAVMAIEELGLNVEDFDPILVEGVGIKLQTKEIFGKGGTKEAIMEEFFERSSDTKSTKKLHDDIGFTPTQMREKEKVEEGKEEEIDKTLSDATDVEKLMLQVLNRLDKNLDDQHAPRSMPSRVVTHGWSQ